MLKSWKVFQEKCFECWENESQKSALKNSNRKNNLGWLLGWVCGWVSKILWHVLGAAVNKKVKRFGSVGRGSGQFIQTR